MAEGGAMLSVRTTCPYCGVGCGVSGSAGAGRALSVAGDAAHPANFGRLCSKGTALGSTVSLEGRLLYPMIGRRRVTWTKAVSTVARRFSETINRYGPDAVAFYVSGQLLTEDYYAVNKLMKGFIGSGNIDTNSRLCMASAVAAHKQAFGEDLVPGCYEDLELADLVVFSGHNAAWTHPILFRRMEAARTHGQRHVVIDPRRTDTAEGCDLHLAIAPQTDVRLWNGLLADLIRHDAIDRAYLAANVSGFKAVEAALAEDDQSPAAVAADCGVPLDDLSRFYTLFAGSPRTVSLFSMGANQSAQGVAKGLAIINAHLATGRIGVPGACPFSITGQPNAMGGRETGGLANTLAAHMDFDDASRERVQRFWGSPAIAQGPGLKAVEMFEAVGDGRIKALWVMATNPAVSLPNAGRVREALARCPFVVVSDCMAQTDTAAFAHVKLPALAWGEKEGTVTNSERRISRQRPLFPEPGEARADWAIVSEVARAMGFADAFGWASPASVFREYARLTDFENDNRVLNLGPLAFADYDAMQPVQWPVTEAGGTQRLFADGRFPTPDGRARMVPVRPRGPAEVTDAQFPLALNTGRVRDQWHTMTRTGLAPELSRHAPEPYVEVHHDDAGSLTDGALARVITRYGEAVVVARISDRQRPGSIFMPMHWTDALAPAGKANPLVNPATDPVSGQPEFKHTPARLTPWREVWRGFFLAREPHQGPDLPIIWRRVRYEECWLHEIGGRCDEAVAANALLRDGEIAVDDPAAGAFRRASLKGGRIDRVLMINRGGALPPREWLAERFLDESLSPEHRVALLLGRAIGTVDPGPIVCACLKVGTRAIEAAIAAGAADVDAVGAATGAGTNCGSCRPEIARALRLKEAA